ncbi:DUF2637 domain-containing protein [Streptomyces sp. NPDC127037]|uniref:DUF2637 domain-containing protein n=1 Tax=Streptomyces sp. NPDC127037 TaxID=3347113 RepID=UPI00364C1311
MMQLTRTHRVLIGLVVAGAVLIAAIGFAGSYAAVRELALSKGFGDFSLVFPIGIDAGICVLLALDLLLTWLRIPFPLLRQTAWLLTAATIAFNGAAAWPDPLGVGMHAVIPVLFVVAVEAARHAVGRIADITADKHMEGVRLTRWLLSPVPTFRLWRRMKLWELRSYEQVIKLEQDRLIHQARLQARYGRAWRRRAPVESLMPLRLAKYGVPLAETGPAGLAAAGIEPALLPTQPLQREADGHPVNNSDRVPVATAVAVALDGGRPVDSRGVKPLEIDAGEPTVTNGQSAEPGEQEGRRPGTVLPEVDYQDAVRGYLSQYGRLPDAGQFSSFLAHYGVVNPATGDPLPGALLGPVLEDVRKQMQAMPEQEGVEERSAAPSGREHHDDDRDQPGAVADHASAVVAPAGEPEPAEFDEGGALFQEDGPWSHTGTAADRTGGTSRITAQVRIPAPAESPEQTRDVLPEPEPGEPAEADELGSGDEQAEEPPVPLIGPALVEHHYRALSPEERQRSANALAPVLAEKTGYAVGTVRKYIGQIKRSDAAALSSTVRAENSNAVETVPIRLERCSLPAPKRLPGRVR